MSWFRRTPHLRDAEKTRPQHPVNDDLRREIEENRRQLEQHRQQKHQETQDGKLH
jgi:hypothetical protein